MRPSAVSSTEATEASLTSPEPVNPAPCHARASPTPVAVRARSVRSGEPGMVPDPARCARWRARARPEALELAGLGGALEDLLAGHARAQDLAGRRRVAEHVDVAPPDLERTEPQRVGDPVEVGLGRELGLRRPEAAERAVGRRVGPRRPGADAHVRAAIRPARVDRAARQDDRRQRAVRAAVHHDLDVLGDQPAVAGHAGPVADDRRVPLGRRGEVLVPVVDHPHRPLGLAGQQRRVQGDHRRVLLLAPESAAGLGLDDARLPVVDGQTALERGVDVVRALERAVDGDPAIARRARRSSRCSRCTAAPGGRPGTRPRGSGRRRRKRHPGRRRPSRRQRTGGRRPPDRRRPRASRSGR